MRLNELQKYVGERDQRKAFADGGWWRRRTRCLNLMDTSRKTPEELEEDIYYFFAHLHCVLHFSSPVHHFGLTFVGVREEVQIIKKLE